MVLHALAVIGEGMDNAAVCGHASAAAAFGDARQLIQKAFELPDASGNGSDLAIGDRMGGIAWGVRLVREIEQLTNIFDREAEVARMPDEGQPLAFRLTVATLVPLGPVCFRQSPICS